MASALNTTTAALNKQTQAIKQSQQQLTGLAGMWQRVQQAMKTSLAYGTAGAAIYGIIDGLKRGITTIADYDQALKNLQAITQATDAEMVGLADTIKDVSAKYVFSTKEISDGMVLMGQAGFTATQTMQAMDAAAKLAMGTL
jgi:rhamnogalacturonyl hydrolase YesR